MKNLKNMIATLGLAVVMMMTVSTAKAGVMFSDLTDVDTNEPCTAQKDTVKINYGVMFSDLMGVMFSDFTGIIITTDYKTPTDCGVIVH